MTNYIDWCKDKEANEDCVKEASLTNLELHICSCSLTDLAALREVLGYVAVGGNATGNNVPSL